MKTKLTALTLCVATACGIAFFPAEGTVLPGQQTQLPIIQPIVTPPAQERPKVEAVFVLDTTGSYIGAGELIGYAYATVIYN